MAARFTDSKRLYTRIAGDYDHSFARPGVRRAYDRLVRERIARLLPGAPGHIVDVGCGTGRIAEWLLDRGHSVTGIERAPGMLAALAARDLPPRFRLVETDMETAELPPGAADLVIACGSLQYSRDLDGSLRRFVAWVRPGGAVAVYVDGLTALVCELFAAGRDQAAMEASRTRRSTFRAADAEASLRLFTAADIVALMTQAGLSDVGCRGLCVSAALIGRAGITRAMARDEDAFLALERELADEPAFTDRGLHLFAWGTRPLD